MPQGVVLKARGEYDAARFANWMMNGQGAGSMETGAYPLGGAITGIITKNSGASVWLPSEDEWYKAAYYDPTPGAGGGDNHTGPMRPRTTRLRRLPRRMAPAEFRIPA